MLPSESACLLILVNFFFNLIFNCEFSHFLPVLTWAQPWPQSSALQVGDVWNNWSTPLVFLFVTQKPLSFDKQMIKNLLLLVLLFISLLRVLENALLSFCQILDCVLGVLYVISLLSLTLFTEEALRGCVASPGHTLSKWRGKNLNPDSLTA